MKNETVPGFTVDIDASNRRMRIVAWGFWGRHTFDRYCVSVVDTRRKLENSIIDSSIDVLVDLREHGVQDKRIAEALSKFHEGLPHRSDRTAIVVATMLHKIQSRRFKGEGNARIFFDHGDAVAWLDQPRALEDEGLA